MPKNALPHVDDHTTVVEAAPDVLWRALCEVLDRSGARPGATGYARLVGCTDRAATGPRPLAAGSALPGFHVTSALPDRELVLEGGHRFSSYALVFRIERTGRGRSALTAETRAVFPGATGGLYRRLVVGTGGHTWATRRLLASVRRRAERGPRPTTA
ncbi:hypothetical protein [Streptomyces sp. NBC_00687]|uniref:hypothetical protein n=1 Tax=Streptomyces sp. NBC_00687 TaxID=2975807 RepID=UPI002256C6F6|nr:hypothetical protein [Streptomyces sp. NBC_00687]MCX4918578.1 hypothetical protein [Streptomyces sp. NBC_00687]